MINIVFDLSNMFFRSMFIVGGFGSKKYTFDNQNEIDQLIRKVSTDISYIIRQTSASRIIFALDSKSWRKNINIEENEGYKGHREKSKFINWDNIYAAMEDFGDILESNGFISSKIENAEADDIMALWTEHLMNEHKQHVLLVSSDEDIRQLVNVVPYDRNKNIFSVVYNPFASSKKKRKLFVPEHFEEWLNKEDEGDIFNRGVDIDKQDFIRLRDTENIQLEKIDGPIVAVHKILCGDDGDNIPAIYSWLKENKKGEQELARITPAPARKIIEELRIKDAWDLLAHKEALLERIKKISKRNPDFNIIDRIERQMKLVVLKSNLFPTQIVDDFKKHAKKEFKKPKVNSQKWNMNSILEGTKYVNAKNSGTEASIFKEIDSITNKLF